MRQSDSIVEIAKALVAVQSALEVIPKTSSNPYYNSKYANVTDAWRLVTPVLVKSGLSITQGPQVREGGLYVLVTRLMHTSGQWVESETPLIGMKDMQSLGSAITYARRYGLMSIVSAVADEEDDDGNHASKPGQVAQPKAPAAKPAKPTPMQAAVNAIQGARPAPAQGAQKGPRDPSKPLSEKQVGWLYSVGKRAGYDSALVDAVAESLFGVQSLSQVQMGAADQLKVYLETHTPAQFTEETGHFGDFADDVP